MTDSEEPATPADVPEAAGDPREAWLEVAMADVDCGEQRHLATAARHGRPLPPLRSE